jgi:phosphoketolase
MTGSHVRGYLDEGTTTTPFDMVVLNKMSRLHLCLDVMPTCRTSWLTAAH